MVAIGGIVLPLNRAALSGSSESAAAAAQTVGEQTATASAVDCGQSPGVKCIEYRNEKYNFSIYHSERRDVLEYDEGGGAATFVFQNIDLVRGFQIFIVPYGGTTVSPERFKMDNRSGIRRNEVQITVDGAVGAAFESQSMALGDTYEIWFIHDGYLYEVTGLLARKEELNAKMQTWRFLN